MALLSETVIDIKHWTNKTFSFKTTRNKTFRFKNGEFAMIGLEIENRPLLRAYSIASPNHEDHLEFLSIKVPNGPLTSKLQHIKLKDEILINSKSTGTLVCDYLLPGRNLFLLSTGTGLAQPNPTKRIIIEPIISKCAKGFIVNLPIRAAVLSPHLNAIHAWANS